MASTFTTSILTVLLHNFTVADKNQNTKTPKRFSLAVKTKYYPEV